MQASPSPKKNSIGKIFLRVFLILICFLLLSSALMPTLLSTSWGKEKLTSIINSSIPGKVKIDNLSLAWAGPQSLQGISLSDSQGNAILQLDSVSTNASLFSLFANPSKMGSLQIQNLNATLISDSDGNTNLMRALDKRCCQAELKQDAIPLLISLRNTQGHINLSPKKDLISLQLNGETEQNALKGSFNVDAELRGIDINEISRDTNDLAAVLQSNPGATLKINADIANFPVELLDQIASMRNPRIAGLISETLGNELNLKIDQKATAHGLAFNVRANSPNVTANADVIIDKDISLANPAEISLKILPSVAEKLMQLSNIKSPWHLGSPTSAKLAITNLQLPFRTNSPQNQIDINALGLKGALDLGQASFIGDGPNNRLILQGLHATLSMEPNSETADISVTSQASHNEQPTKIDFNLTIPKKAILKSASDITLKDVTLKGNIASAPLFLLDGFTDGPLPLSMLTGRDADIAFSLQMKDNKPLAEIQLKSEKLSIPHLAFSIGSHLTLQKPAQIILNLNQSLVNGVLQNLGPQMQGPATAQLTLNSFSAPLSRLSSSLKMLYKVDVDALLKVTSLRMTNVPKIGGLSLNDFNVRLTSSTKTRPELVASFSLQPDGQSVLSHVIGDTTTFKTAASLGIGLDGNLIANVFNVQILSDLARIELSGEMHEGNRLILNTPSMFSYTFTAAGLQSMGVAADTYLFKHGAPLEMTIDSSHIPTSLNDFSLLKLSGKLKINDFQLMKNTSSKESLAVIDNLTADWAIDAASKLISVDFSGITRLGENQAAGKINGSLNLTKWIHNGALDLNQAAVRVNAIASKLPTELISVLSGQRYLAPIIGNAVDLSIEADASLAQAENGTISIDINSENLSGGFGLTLGDEVQLSNKRPAEFTLNLTPQGYSAIRSHMNKNYAANFVLSSPTTAKLKLKSLRLPRSQSFLQSGIEGEFSLDRLIGMDAQQNKITLNSINGHLTSGNISESLNFDMQASGHTDQGNPTAWNMVGVLNNGFLPDGSVNRQDLSMALDANIQSLPISLLCQFVCVDPKLKLKIETVLGSKIDGKIKTQLQRMNGPLFVEVIGDNARFVVDAYLNQGIMTLNQDLTAQLSVPPQLGEYVLKDLIPVLSGMLSADHPINLTISKDGFAIPLRDPTVTNIAIGSAVLDMGKVHFSGESQIAKVLNLLTPATSDQLVWITPAYFSLNQGLLRLQRVDMLISDRYPIAAWGDADIGRDRVNMVVGLSGSAISKAFNVPRISNVYFLQLPLKGKLSNPSIDKTKAIARISALVAQSQGGAEGLVLGTVLDIASGGLTENAIPSPTTNPLPWSNLMQDGDSQREANHSSGHERKTIPNPIEEIGKGASSILKKIFK